MKRIIVEEYDDNGKLTKKIITEEIESPTYYPIWSVCTCGQTTVCSLHPYGIRPWYYHTISNSGTLTATEVKPATWSTS